MNAQLSMFAETTSEDSANGISSAGSAAGPTRFASPVGPTTVPSPPDHVPVSRFRSRDSSAVMPTNDTSGPLFTASSPSASFQSSLESRLRARLDENGSPEFALIWKATDMPAGPPICALRPSGRRTSGNGCSGWPTPTTLVDSIAHTPERWEQRNAEAKKKNIKLGALEKPLATVAMGWATPKASDGEGGRTVKTQGGGNAHLPIQAREAHPWPTPTTSMVTGAGTSGREGGLNLQSAAAWATPSARDWKDVSAPDTWNCKEERSRMDQVGRQVHLYANWPTPTVNDSRNGRNSTANRKPDGKPFQLGDTLVDATDLASGRTQNGASEQTARRGALAPAFVCWLMGFPPEWDACADTGTRSSRKLRKRSSKR